MATAEQPREKALHELLSHHMVDIYVGSDNTHWILHEKLLCAKSKFFNKIFYTKFAGGSPNRGNKTFGLPDEEDEPFRLFVGWLYSGRVPPPEEEKELADLFDLYLMGEKWQIAGLVKDVLTAVRKWYRFTDTFPGLRRVQYIYANSDQDSPMRQLLVSSVARMLVLGESIPSHWDKALKKNGELALDIIRAVQLWKLDPESVPDAREEAQVLEKEMVKEVEEAEQQIKIAPKKDEKSGEEKDEQANDEEDEQANDEEDEQASGDDQAEAVKDMEHLTNGVGGSSNGASDEED